MLAVVRLVLHFKLAAAVNDVTDLLSAFLVPDMPLDRACRFGSMALLEFVWSKGIQERDAKEWSIARLPYVEPRYCQYIFSRAMVAAIQRGGVDMAEWVFNHFSGCRVDDFVVKEAARGGHLQLLKLLEKDERHRGISWSSWRQREHIDVQEFLQIAARNKHWETVRWLDERIITPQCRDSEHLLVKIAIKQNDEKQVQWLVERGYKALTMDCFRFGWRKNWQLHSTILRYVMSAQPETADIIAAYSLVQAVHFGDSQVFEWALSNPTAPGAFEEALLCTSEQRDLQKAQLLVARMEECGLLDGPSIAMRRAISDSNLCLIRWLYERYGRDPNVRLFQKMYDDRELMDIVAENGNLETLQFLHRLNLSARNKRKERNGDAENEDVEYPRCTPKAMDNAAADGYLHIVKWLHTNRSEGCTTKAMDKAAASGRLDMVKWLHANRSEGCTTGAMDRAAYNEHFHIVEWLHQNRSEGFTTSAIDTLVRRCIRKQVGSPDEKKRVEIIRFLLSHRSEGCSDHAMDIAAANGNLPMLQLLHESSTAGCTVDAMDKAAAHGWLDIVKWLHSNRSEGCTTAAMDGAAASGHLKVVKWLHSNRSEGCSGDALPRAAASGHLEVVKWLSKTCCMEGNQAIALASAAEKGKISIVRWLLSNCVQVDKTLAMAGAICNSQFEVALLLHFHGRVEFTDEEIVKLKGYTANAWSMDYYAWLKENYPRCSPWN